MNLRRRISAVVFLLFVFLGLPVLLSRYANPPITPAQAHFATPTYDPLAPPPLPENPTQIELGRYLYWRNCMPCHGDRGQGLTDEWRAVWVPDHQNCWARGCHSGRADEKGFPIPTVVPPLIGPGRLEHFSSPEILYEYLHKTHPPQNPGYLQENEYRAITLFLLAENGRGPIATVSPPTPGQVTVNPTFLISLILGALLVTILIVAARRRK